MGGLIDNLLGCSKKVKIDSRIGPVPLGIEPNIVDSLVLGEPRVRLWQV